MSELFKINDKVTWISTSMGTTKEKSGTVIKVVPPNMFPDMSDAAKGYHATSMYGGGGSRGHESYVVMVPGTGRAKPRLYWPRVSALRRA